MSHEESSAPAAASPLIPLLVLGLSLASILIWQIININTQSNLMAEGKAQYSDAIEKRETVVKQSVELQAKLQALVIDLLELAKTDEKAKAIVAKYNIQQAAPAAPAPAPAK